MKIRSVGLVLVVVLLLTGCSQSLFVSPIAIAPDGRTAAFLGQAGLLDSGTSDHVELLDLASGAFRRLHFPPFDRAATVRWLGPCVLCQRGTASWLWNSRANASFFHDADALSAVWYPAFAGTYANQAAVFLPESTTDIRSLPGLKPLGKLDYPVRGLRDGYMLRYTWNRTADRILTPFGWMSVSPESTTQAEPLVLRSIDVLTPDLHVAGTIGAAGAAGSANGISDSDAQLSPDHRRLLLGAEGGPYLASAFNRDSIIPEYHSGWALYDVTTGNLLAAGQSPRIIAPLMLTNDALYGIEESIPEHATIENPTGPRRTQTRADHQFWLVRIEGQNSTRLLQIPVPAPSSPWEAPFTTAVSPAADYFLLYAPRPAPHILQISLRRGGTANDIRDFSLPASAR